MDYHTNEPGIIYGVSLVHIATFWRVFIWPSFPSRYWIIQNLNFRSYFLPKHISYFDDRQCCFWLLLRAEFIQEFLKNSDFVCSLDKITNKKKLQNKTTPFMFVIFTRQNSVREADWSGIIESIWKNSNVIWFFRFLGADDGFG